MKQWKILFLLSFYKLSLTFYNAFLFLASFKNSKAKKMLVNRKYLLPQIKANHQQNNNTIWMHCASVGEYEQGLPIAQELKKNNANCKIVLTFFSSSGVDAFKANEAIDEMYYLPFDSKQNAKDFIEIINPKIAIFIKYEFWYFYLTTLKFKNINTYIVCMYLAKNNIFQKWYGGLHRQMLNCFTTLFVQDINSLKALQTLGLNNVVVAGDTRFDRMQTIVNTNWSDEKIEQFCRLNKIIVAGSTWAADEKILFDWWKSYNKNDWKLIIVPHQLEPTHLQNIKALFSSSITTYSDTNFNNNANVLLLDKMGMLNKIYRYAYIAYIGGGFGAGIHNIVEPLSYTKPVIYGPKCNRFLEAKLFGDIGTTFIINNASEILKTINNIDANYNDITIKIKNKLADNIGEVNKIIKSIA